MLQFSKVKRARTVLRHQRLEDAIRFALFGRGEQGAWYDPSDMTTMFKDSAGTTPVTAMEDPVGLILDKSNGVPVARRNYLAANSENLSASTTFKAGAGSTPVMTYITTDKPAVASYGATRIVLAPNGIGVGDRAGVNINTNLSSGTNVLSIYLKTSDASTKQVIFRDAIGSPTVYTVTGAWTRFSSNAFTVTSNIVQIWTTGTLNGGATVDLVASCVQRDIGSDLKEYQYHSGNYGGWIVGNHAYQTTDAKRPVLSARVNMLTSTEDFNSSSWIKTGAVLPTIDSNVAISPIGSMTADRINFGSSVDSMIRQDITGFGAMKYSVWAKVESGTKTFLLMTYSVADGVKLSSVFTATTEWQKFTWDNTITVNSAWYVRNGESSAKSILFWGADLRNSNVGVGLPDYQRVNTATGYDTSGFPLYLRANGVGSTLSTGAIDLTGTDKVLIWAGIRKQSDAAQGVVAELSNSIAINNGSFLLSAPFSAAGNYGFSSRGTARQDTVVVPYSAPITSVLTARASISGPSNSLSVNGVVNGTNTASQGTGNYGNHALNLFSRDGTSLFFSGGLYQFILRGAETDAQTSSLIDSYTNGRTRAY